MIRTFSLFALVILCNATVFCQPVITDFSPHSGAIGTSVVIKGSGFDTVASNNIVFFGAVRAVVSSGTDTTITTTVPFGTSYQPITVTTGNRTAYSSAPFTVTFSGASGPFTSTSFLPKADITTSYYPHAISIADFNGDGKPDVVVAKGSSSSISVLTNTSTNGTVSFSSPMELAASGNSHECAATGDLDGDGKIDLVTANTWNSNSISAFRNTTTGSFISFAAKQDYPTVNGAYSVDINDLDGDGKPDIIVANNGSDSISLYKNRSTPGVFQFDSAVNLAAASNPYSVVAADIDGDGKPELIYTTQNATSNLSIMKNRSIKDSFGFDSPVSLASIGAPFVVAVGDIDGDGLPDIAAASGGGYVLVKRNLSTPGNIAFSGLQQNFSTADYAEGLAIADFDGDGKPDLAATNRTGGTVSLLKNTSSPGSVSFDPHVDYAVGDAPIFLAAADLNSDGRPDIVSANSSSTYISILTNIIAANVAPVIQSFTPTSGVAGTSVLIKGVNFTGTTAISFGGVNVASFTVNSDSTITAIVGQGNSGDVAVTTSKGTATAPGFTFTGPTVTSFTPSVGVPGTVVNIYGTNFINVSSVKFGDSAAASFTVNTPNFISAVVGSGSSGAVSVTTSLGTASRNGFSYGVPVITRLDTLFAPVGATITIIGKNFSSTAADNTVFFGAVKAQLTAASDSELKVTVPAGATYEPVTVTVNRLTAYSPMPFSSSFVADSTTISTSSFSKAGDYSAGSYPVHVSFCDLDLDGRPDIITSNAQSNNISVLKNISTAGHLSFLQKNDLSTGTDTKRTATGDLDGDGRPDVVAMNFNTGNASTISVFRNTSVNGTISFASKMDYATGNGSLGLAIADLNGDGKPDIVTTSGNSGFFSIFQNTTATAATISFAPRMDITNLNHGDALTVADLDNDGRPDIIIGEFSSGAVSVYRNISSAGQLQFDSRNPLTIGGNPADLEAVDIDGDGKLDIIVRNSSSTAVLKNNSNPGYISLVNTFNDFSFSATNGAIADLNGDGKPDICFGRTQDGMISVVENKYTTRGIPSFGSIVNFTSGNFDTFVGAGDLDGDGRPELAATNTLLNTVTLFSNIINLPVLAAPATLSVKSGDTLSIPGNNLSGATSVKFGGTPAASFKVITATRIDAVVGDGASGNITVTTPAGTADYPGFKFVPVVTATGPTTICKESTVVLNSSAGSGNQWYVNNTAIAGATAKTYSTSNSGNYTVKTTSNNITTASSNSVDVVVITVPTPVISFTGGSLVSTATSGNQWYLNGTAIPGATGQTYQPSQAGNYVVQSTVNGCASSLSAAYSYFVTGILNLPNGQFINVYPNPIKDKLFISYQLGSTTAVTLKVFDALGKEVFIKPAVRSGDVINLSSLQAGLYVVKISSKNRSFQSIRLVKGN